MNQSPEISIIIPVYNEAASLPQLQVELFSVMRDYDHEIVFIDDGSSDNSAKQIQRSPRIRLLQFVKNCGQSAHPCPTLRLDACVGCRRNSGRSGGQVGVHNKTPGRGAHIVEGVAGDEG